MKNIILALILIILLGCGSSGNRSAKQSLKPWPNGEILYRFSQDITPIHKKRLEAVFNTIEDNTKCVSFIKSEDQKAIHIQYAEGQINWATTGYGDNNFMMLNKAMSWRTMYHETFHTLGVTHEHQRPDRDNYIEILYDNIEPGYSQYFDIVEPLYNYGNIPYETNSIMHYNATTFSETNSIDFIDNDYTYSQEPTFYDYQKIIDIYSY